MLPIKQVEMKIPASNAQLDYLPNFLDVGRARSMFDTLMQEVPFKQDDIVLFGQQRKIPRLQAWYGDFPYQYSGLLMQPQPWSQALMTLKSDIENYCQCQFNSALINLYRDNQDSVAWHSDDEAELGRNPVIASLSLGASRDFKLKHKFTDEKHTIPLVEGSLLVMAGETQHYWQHAVLKSKKVAGPRINLTFRQISEQSI